MLTHSLPFDAAFTRRVSEACFALHPLHLLTTHSHKPASVTSESCHRCTKAVALARAQRRRGLIVTKTALRSGGSRIASMSTPVTPRVNSSMLPDHSQYDLPPLLLHDLPASTHPPPDSSRSRRRPWHIQRTKLLQARATYRLQL